MKKFYKIGILLICLIIFLLPSCSKELTKKAKQDIVVGALNVAAFQEQYHFHMI